jgi:hypothetical protein
MVRYSHAAGARDFEFFSAFQTSAGSDAKPAVPDLTQLLNDPLLRTPAKYALRQIDPEAAAKLGLINTLVRTRAGWELSK